MVLSPIIINILTTPFMYFFWIKNSKMSYILFIVAIAIILINIFIHTLLFAYSTIDYNEKYILTIMMIKLFLIFFFVSILFCCTNIQKGEMKEEELNEDIQKNKYLRNVNIYLLNYIIIYIIIFYIYNAKGVVKYADNIYPFVSLYIIATGLPTLYVFGVMNRKDFDERKKMWPIFAILNFFCLLTSLYLTIILFKIYAFIYVLWIVFFLLLTMVIYTSLSHQFSFFLFLFYPFSTFLIIYYIIYNLFRPYPNNLFIPLVSLAAIAYILTIEIYILVKREINYDEVIYTVTVINYIKYIGHALMTTIYIAVIYYLYCLKCCCSYSCNEATEEFIYFWR